MTVCNMSIEGGARAGMIAPDDTTFEYLAGRPHAPQGADWDAAVRALAHAAHRRRRAPTIAAVTLDAAALEPMITYGTNPGMGMPIDGAGARSGAIGDRRARRARQGARATWTSQPGKPLLGQPVDVVFIGSCTNSRISDLRAGGQRASRAARSRPGVRVLVVPGSQQVKRRPRPRGSTEIFRDAGAEWREAGCSMCIAMNGDQLAARPVRGQHQQPQLRRPPGQGRPHLPGQPAHRGRGRASPARSPTCATLLSDG